MRPCPFEIVLLLGIPPLSISMERKGLSNALGLYGIAELKNLKLLRTLCGFLGNPILSKFDIIGNDVTTGELGSQI